MPEQVRDCSGLNVGEKNEYSVENGPGEAVIGV